MSPLAAAIQTAIDKIEVVPHLRQYRHPRIPARCAWIRAAILP